MNEAWPTELKVSDQGRRLQVRFDNDEHFSLSAEFLRVESPSAEVKGHGPGQEQLEFGKKLVSITKIEPVGTYAARIIFSDGHASGLYTWSYLMKLGKEQDNIWNSYLEKLKSEGCSREP